MFGCGTLISTTGTSTWMKVRESQGKGPIKDDTARESQGENHPKVRKSQGFSKFNSFGNPGGDFFEGARAPSLWEVWRVRGPAPGNFFEN